MQKNRLFKRSVVIAITALFFTLAAGPMYAQRARTPAQLNSPANRDVRRVEALKEEIRHQLVTLPYYSVFDWLAAEVKPDGTVKLMGEVTRPTLKDDAENRVKKLEAVNQVIDDIEVLPLSPMDDGLRIALYRAIFNFNSPLFRYATQSVPPIHIIVKNGRATLKGVVMNQMDSQLAYMAAQGVPGLFEVKNELMIEQRDDEKVSRK
jgi:hyperosmotically inducible protein